jgi:dihydrolipoamide dehydrogenase
LGDYAGWVKLITDAKYGEILGGHMIGPEVTELLPELTIAQMMELTTAEIARNVHAHPTLSETLMEAAHAAEGHAIQQSLMLDIVVSAILNHGKNPNFNCR